MRSELQTQKGNRPACPRLRAAIYGNSQVKPLVKMSRSVGALEEPGLSSESKRYCWTMAAAFAILAFHFMASLAAI